MHLTYTELKDQYNSLKKTFDYIVENCEKIKQFYKEKKPSSILFIGCGSSYYVSHSLEMIAKVNMGIPASSIPAGDLMLHYESYRKLLDNTLIVAISRSGNTTEIINSVNKLKSIGEVPVLSITCVKESQLSKISDITLEIPWAFDESVCQTRTVTNLYTSGALIIANLADNSNLVSDIYKAINIGNDFIIRYEDKLKAVAQMKWENAVILADGELCGISMEAALAFKEIAQVSSNYYHLLDSRHGPIVLINNETLVIACLTLNNYKYQSELIKDVVKKGAKVVVYTDLKSEEIDSVQLHVFSGDQLDHTAKGIHFIILSQIIAYYKALERGVNPDRPDGLDPWIKL